MNVCEHCQEMPTGYYCYVCKRTDGTSDFEFQWYVVEVRIIATEPVVVYRHGPRKGEPKGTAWTKTLYESPTHYYNCEPQGIRNAETCKRVIESSYANLVKEFVSLGYTDVRVVVSAYGVHL